MTEGKEIAVVKKTNHSKELVIKSDYLIPVDKKVFGELTITKIKESDLSISDKEVALACYSACKIKDMDANDAGKSLQQLINLVMFESGMEVQNMKELIVIVVRDIFKDFSFMTIDEVKLAFHKGVREEFGELRGINVRQFYVWLRAYNNQVKKEAMERLKYINKPSEKVYTPEDIQAIHKNWITSWIKTYNNWDKGKDLEDVIDADSKFYEYCIKNGIGTIHEDIFNDLYKRAETTFKRSKSAKYARNKVERVNFKAQLDKLNQEDDLITYLITKEAKRLAIEVIFRQIRASGATLKRVIDDNNKLA